MKDVPEENDEAGEKQKLLLVFPKRRCGMPGKGEKNSSFIDAYLSKSKGAKQEEKTEMAGEHQVTGDFAGEEKTFPFVNRWGQEITMREKPITIPILIKENGKIKQIPRTYTFIFSPGGWELWQRKKDLLIEGLQWVFAAIERENTPEVEAIFVLQKAYSLDDDEEEEDVSKWKTYYAVLLSFVSEGIIDHSQYGKMIGAFYTWLDRKLPFKDIELSKKLAFDVVFGRPKIELWRAL